WKSEVLRDCWRLGIYVCSECDHQLFSSVSKFSHHSPWPAFSETLLEDSVKRRPEMGEGYVGRNALKVVCGKCGNGLGHEFLKDGPDGKSRF
ncbi:unnamed protein product, partial [Oppiella nova]